MTEESGLGRATSHGINGLTRNESRSAWTVQVKRSRPFQGSSFRGAYAVRPFGALEKTIVEGVY